MADWDSTIQCGANTFEVVVTRPPNVGMTSISVEDHAGVHRITIDYKEDDSQTDSGPDTFDTGVPHGTDVSFHVLVMLGGKEVVEKEDERTCP